MANPNNKKKANEPVEEVTRAQRLLMYVGGSVLGLGIACMFALIIGEFTARQAIQYNEGRSGS